MFTFRVNFTEVCSYGSNWQYPSIGSDNGLAPNRRQAIIWMKEGLGCRRRNASLGVNELMQSCSTCIIHWKLAAVMTLSSMFILWHDDKVDFITTLGYQCMSAQPSQPTEYRDCDACNDILSPDVSYHQTIWLARCMPVCPCIPPHTLIGS